MHSDNAQRPLSPSLQAFPGTQSLSREVHSDLAGIEMACQPSVLDTFGQYEVHTAWEGFSSIRHVASGEIMHSRTPPMEEARSIYVEQSRLPARLREATAEPLVIWDVGLGAAANAMAAMECYENLVAQGSARPLHIVSFENDLDSLRLALRNIEKFPYLRHAAPPIIATAGEWSCNVHHCLSWSLVEGDFLQSIETENRAPDIIYYDMFSGKTTSGAWTLKTFQRLFARCVGRSVALCTYTCSTASRVAMLAAGFYVARGRNAGGKEETSIALTPQAVRPDHELLSTDWLGRWRRSSARFPADVPSEDYAVWARVIEQHPQFAGAL